MTDVSEPQTLSEPTSLPVTNEKLTCKFCNSTILSENIGKMIYDRSIDIPLMVQKKDANETQRENLVKFCVVEKVHDFDNVGVTRSHEGRVYLTCADCEAGPVGLKDPDSTQYLIAIERILTNGKTKLCHKFQNRTWCETKGYKTPPPKKYRMRSPSPEYSPLPPAIAAKLNASLESPGYLSKRHTSTATVIEKMKKKAALKPRLKDSRALMNGYECRCCKNHYDSLGLKGEERRNYVNKVSKHRGFQEMPPTPPRYWDLDVPTPEESRRLGYVIYTDSPLFKKKKRH